MALNDVKEITIPEGSVKQIQDSNGNIIWGSQSAFPYRRLEYIHFSGGEHLFTNYVPNYNTAIKFKLEVTSDWSGGDGNNGLFGGWCGTLSSDNSKRLYWIWARHLNPKTYRCVIGNTWTSTDLSLINEPAWFGVGFANSSAFKNAAFGIRNNAWDTALFYLNQPNSTAFTGWTTQFALGTINTQTNTVDTTRYSCINVYEGYQHNNASPWGTTVDSNNPVKHWVPVQRKSDNICGLYDVLNNTFYPMAGTSITSGAAGPIVDEYWNLQA